MEHRRVKQYYSRVHKGQFVKGIAKQTQCEHILNILTEGPKSSASSRKRKFKELTQATEGNPSLSFLEQENLPPGPADKAYQMSTEIRHKMDIYRYLGDHEDDPALMVHYNPCHFNCLMYQFSRIFFLVSKITFWANSLDRHTRATSLSSLHLSLTH